MKKLKKEMGITLIALVVTIIVLIILAGVSISLVLGDNGIITKAKEARLKSDIAQAREKIEVVLGEASIEKFTNLKYTQNKYLTEMILNKVPNSKVTGDVVIVDGYGFTIDRNIPAIVDYVGKEEDLTFPGISPSISYSPNGSTEWQKEYRVKITTENVDGVVKYQWTDTPGEPDANTFNKTVGEDGIILEKSLTGKYYLWTLVEDSSGNEKIEKSNLFYFDNTPPSAKVELGVADHENQIYSINVSDAIDEHSGIKNNQVTVNFISKSGEQSVVTYSLNDGTAVIHTPPSFEGSVYLYFKDLVGNSYLFREDFEIIGN